MLGRPQIKRHRQIRMKYELLHKEKSEIMYYTLANIYRYFCCSSFEVVSIDFSHPYLSLGTRGKSSYYSSIWSSSKQGCYHCRNYQAENRWLASDQSHWNAKYNRRLGAC